MNQADVSQIETKKTVPVLVALLIVFVFIVLCVVSGYAIGYKFFWYKFDKASRADKDIFAYSAKVKQDPRDLDSLLKLAWLAYEKKEYDLAIQSSNMALDVNAKDPNAHYVLAIAYLEQKKYQLAEKEFETLKQNNANNTKVLIGLGRAYLALDQPEKAITVLEELLSYNRTLADGHLLLGQAYLKNGKKSLALEHFNEVLRFSPDNQEVNAWISAANNT